MRKLLKLGPGILICSALLAGACEEKTAEERGAEMAQEKLDLVKGAAGVLDQQGNAVGETAGRGVGDALKGIGSGLKDVVFAQVPVKLAAGAAESGITVGKATEGDNAGGKRMVNVYLTFAKPFDGRLRLRAFEAGDVETGRADAIDGNVHRKAGDGGGFAFAFDETVRLSKLERCDLETLPTEKKLRADPGAAEAGIEANQLTETVRDGKLEVSLYAIFRKAFKGTAELRIFDADDKEIGRSEPTPKLDQAADSSSTIAFEVTAPIDQAKIETYEFHVATARGKAKTKTKTKSAQ